MDQKYHTITITIYDRGDVYKRVGSLLHEYADKISLRVGYPVPDKDVAIIFVIINATPDEIGALSGRLGQIDKLKVKSVTLKL